MDGESVGRTRNTHYLNVLTRIQDLLSSFFARHAFSLPTSPQNLFHGATNVNNEMQKSGCFVDSVFGSVPTQNEVEFAVASLQSFMQRVSPAVIGQDLLQSWVSRNDQRILQSPVLERIDDAFRLLQTMPSVLRMVVSVSSDRAVWDAVVNNIEVQDFQSSFNQARLCRQPVSDEADEKPDLVSMIFRWISDNMKHTVMGLVQTLKSLVENINREPKHQLEELIYSTVLLSILTLMIVLVTRVYEA